MNIGTASRWLLLAATCWIASPSGSHAAETPTAQAITIDDPNIPIDQLKWRLKPLTLEELIVEADGWRDLLKEKVRQIGAAEIAVKRQNEQIQKAEKAADAVTEAKEAAETVEKQAGTTDAGASAEAEAEAKKAAQAAQKALGEAKEAATKADQDASSQAAKELVEQSQQQKAAADGQPAAEGTTNAPEVSINEASSEALDTNRVAAAETLAQVADTAQQVAKQETKEKADLLETLAALRDQRTILIDRFDVVILELQSKGGEIASYEKYRDAVSEIILDVSDTSAVWTYASTWVTSEQGGIKWAVNIGKMIVLLAVFYFLSIIAGKAADKATSRSKRKSELLRSFIVTMSRRGVLLIGIIVAISALGVNVTPVLAIITAAGFVIGLALQGTLSNFASGLLILFYRPFDVGDAVDAGGVAGSVTNMNLMSTRIQTWDNKSMIVPNNQIWGSVITNISGTTRRRVDMVFGIGYGDSMDKAQTILERIVNEHPKVMKDPAPVVKVHELGDSSVNFIVRPWVVPADYWAVYWDVTRSVKEQFDKGGVSIPFPQRDVHLYKADS